MDPEQQSNAQEPDQQGDGEQQQQGGEEADKKTRSFSQKEWDERQAEFDRKANKIRRNAARDAELKFRREAAAPKGGEQRQEQKEDPNPEPKREDFEDYEAFMRAIGRWEGRKAAREEHTRVGKEAEEKSRVEQERRAASEFKKRANTLMEEIPDFGEVIEDADGVMITDTMGQEIQDSPVGPRILYELAKNPEEAARIAELPKKAQVREILKLESRYEAEAAAKAKTKNKDDEKGDEDADGSEDEERADDQGDDEEKADAEDKGEDQGRRRDGTFKSAKKRAAPEPIEPGTARGATGSSRLPSDKDDIETWNRKMDEIERREGRR